MATLKSLETDNLRDTIVEVRYEALVDYTILKGLLYGTFFDKAELISSIYQNRSYQFAGLPDFKLATTRTLEFHKDNIKFTFSEDRISFNRIDDYPGWDNYFPVIRWVLSILHEREILRSVSQLGVRYISDHSSQEIGNITNVSVLANCLEGEVNQTSFRFDLIQGEDTLAVILSDVPFKGQESQSSRQAVIDIDTVHRFSEKTDDLDLILSTIDRLHRKEKETFVNLLDKDYLSSLKPKYAQ